MDGRTKKLMLIVLPLTAVMIITGMFYNFYRSSKTDYVDFAAVINENQATVIETKISNMHFLCSAVTGLSENMRAAGSSDRELLLDMLQKFLMKSDQFYAITLCYEPQAFDGLDEKFAVYIYKSYNECTIEPAYGLDDDDDEWYLAIKENPVSFVSSPEHVKISGDTQMVVTEYMPIMDDGNFIGVAGVSVSLAEMEVIMGDIGERDGYCVLVDSEGLAICNDYPPVKVNENVWKSNDFPVEKHFHNDFPEVTREEFKGVNGKTNVIFGTKIHSPSEKEPWHLYCIMPMSSILAGFFSSVKLLIIAIIVTTLVIGALFMSTWLSKRKTKDELTGLYNRAYLNRELPRIMNIAKTKGKPLCIVMCDLDHFKKVNDTYGHVSGDKVLQDFSRMLGRTVRDGTDWTARYGGEEFFICLPGTSLENAIKVVERMLGMVRNRRVDAEMPDKSKAVIKYTVSCGIMLYDPQTHTNMSKFIEGADKNLYTAKERGRDRLCAALQKGIEE